MAQVSTYLNFERSTEEAFNFYKSIFGTEFQGQVMRHGDVPQHEGQTEQSDEDKNLIMHVSLPILGGHVLMGTDFPESMGSKLIQGNNVSIMLQPDTKEEADELYAALSAGGTAEDPMKDQFWGDYFGYLVDKFGIHWMINVSAQQ